MMVVFCRLSLLCALLGQAAAFHVSGPAISALQQQRYRGQTGRLYSSTLDGTDAPSIDKSAITQGPKDRLLDTALGLKDKFGVFIIDKKGQEDLRKAVDDLEAVSERPAFDDEVKDIMIGNWTLVCTTSQSTSLPEPLKGGIDTSKLPFFNEGPLKQIRDSLNKCLVVEQAIKTDDFGDIDRVDHILEYKPPSTLQDIIDKLPSININPLDVTKGKVILIHEADVSNTGPGFSIKLKLASVVVNVAGKNSLLDPKGQDVLGINSPLKEFQAGTFETTYLDGDLRISRTSYGSFDQLRVYVKSEPEEVPVDDPDEEYFDEFDKFGLEEDEVVNEVVDAEIVEDDIEEEDPGIEK